MTKMAEKGMGIPDTFLHARFFRALPDEYGHVKAMLQGMNNRGEAPYGRHAVLHPAPVKGVAAVISAARASILLE